MARDPEEELWTGLDSISEETVKKMPPELRELYRLLMKVRRSERSQGASPGRGGS